MSSDKDDKYYSVSDEYKKLTQEPDTKTEKAASVAKLLGKSLFNVAKFTVTTAVPAFTKAMLEQNQRIGNEALKRDDLTAERRAVIENSVAESKAKLRDIHTKERDDRLKEQEESRKRERFEKEKTYSQSAEESRSISDDYSEKEGSPIETKKYEELTFGSKSDTEVVSSETKEYTKSEIKIIPSLIDFIKKVEFNDDEKERLYILGQKKELNFESVSKILGRKFNDNEKVLFCFDDTLFKSGTSGLLVTEDFISFRFGFGSGDSYFYKYGWLIDVDEVPKSFKYLSEKSLLAIMSSFKDYSLGLLDYHLSNAISGDVNSQFFLSCVPVNLLPQDKSYYWLIRSAIAGHAVAQHNLGVITMCFDHIISERFLSKAVGNGHKHAEGRLDELKSRLRTGWCATEEYSYIKPLKEAISVVRSQGFDV